MPPNPVVKRGRQRGQTLVEFALVLPVFVALTLGVLDGARVFAAQVALSNAAREAAMFAARGTNYLAWCRAPDDEPDEIMPVTVGCPSGAGATNYSTDPNNIAYRVAVEADGMDRTRIVLEPPRCGTGSSKPATTCASGTTPKYVLVRITYQMDLLTPVVAQLWGKPLAMSAEAVGRVNQ